ncbi:hypothetical protein QFZ89_004973 [Paraburkholderia youngii]
MEVSSVAFDRFNANGECRERQLRKVYNVVDLMKRWFS